MVSYEKLRSLLESRGISFRTLRKEVGITSNVAANLNNDRPVSIERLAEICLYLDVPIEAVVEVLPKESD
ncbi:helix-turn-helix transcriptional regulator [Psychrobacillus sp. OK032]|uniref:helix-turn-helix domain-containing protein n=1 Tax=Psychrobacillus sp. OK032 TaxID=1884358 RepID=UPI0008BBD4C1|nr:helix-turn-helix transcriptional regulator [Psychrobacillus sp. OK032]SER88352.1 DNA-binding transcriptional regulator, XRE family [Psychrobacillus sp. OK032]